MCNNSASTDRTQQLDAYGKLNAAGSTGASTGASATGSATDYFTKLLSGNPAAVTAAAQPELNAAAGREQQQKQVLANQGGARTGGTDAAIQQIGTDADAGVEDAIAKERSTAAPALAQIGGQETGQGITATSDLGSEASTNRAQSAKLHADAVSNWAKIINGGFSGKGIIPTIADSGVLP